MFSPSVKKLETLEYLFYDYIVTYNHIIVNRFKPPVNYLLKVPKTGKGKVQGVPQSQTAALPRHQEEEESDKAKQAAIKQTYEKH